jgi:hypothetical protein
MASSPSPKRMRHSLLLSDDLLRLIFAKLDFKSKFNAASVCKEWEMLLNTGSSASRHWVVDYSINKDGVTDFSESFGGPQSQRQGSFVGRYVKL